MEKIKKQKNEKGEEFWEIAPLNEVLSNDYKYFKSKKGFTFGMSSILTNTRIDELDSINQYRKEKGVQAFCINSSTLDGTNYLLMMNFDKKVFDELAKVKDITLIFKMYHKSKCEIITTSNMYKKNCTMKMYDDYKKNDSSYNGISQYVEVRSTNGDKGRGVKKEEKKEEVEYNVVIFEIRSDFIRNRFAQILIDILNKLQI